MTFTATSDCSTQTCSAAFIVTAAPTLTLNCQNDTTVSSCSTQADVSARYAAWLAGVTTTGGCNTVLTNNAPAAPNACTGGTATVTFVNRYQRLLYPDVLGCIQRNGGSDL